MMKDGYHSVPPGKLAMVVTYLEMTTPRLRNVPCPDGLTFCELPRDLTIYRDLIRRVGQDWLWAARLELTDQELTQVLNDPLVSLHTLEKDGQPEAILELDFREQGMCELAFYGLTPELIGSGAGAYLMDRGIERAFDAGITRFHLHTCSLDSPQALGFYIRSGFTPYARKVEIMADPRITGLLPRSAARQVPIL
jgi:N-acetylglutamate synthase-like GNAT family acetyltransferase